MSNYNLPIYDSAKNSIDLMRSNGADWSNIKENYQILKENLVISENIREEVWIELVNVKHEEYKKQLQIKEAEIETAIISTDEDNDTTIPTGSRTSWQLYRKKLSEKGLSQKSIEELEDHTIKLLRKLSRDTSTSGPKKGLVIGQVQSGKTASMAGLMAMAADWGWNTFIILSGMVENLRRQTQYRLINDLNSPGDINWRSLHQLSRHSEEGNRTQDLNFDSSQRYLNVCLKNKIRLEDLLGWLKDDKNKLRQMKILVIDDEADQGSINTKNIDKSERSKINELLVELVNVSSNSVQPKSMNYISYTATPYSNFLNESHPESLYPKDFIGVLPVAEEYFGPQIIFGSEESEESERLDIVRLISEGDVEAVKELQSGESTILPKSFIDSVVWFFNAAAVKRFYGIQKPVSMLIHTSQFQNHHDWIASAVTGWINVKSVQDLLDLCRDLYIREKNRFNVQQFRKSFSNYPISDIDLRGYPPFFKIQPFIKELKKEISHIQMDEEGDLTYHQGIHLCIDNSSHTGVTDENMHIRLAYPSSRKLKKIGPAPAFIIIGGNTLSRGLTIEGLVSTYFFRAATSADTLMQMGRWFGYRKGYELFPRIWLTRNTFLQFQFLTSLENELREELEDFALGNRSPTEYGPRVKNTPKVSWLRVTSQNKMQGAQEIEMDFTGASIQTIHFKNNLNKLKQNINVTENFLNLYCGSPSKSVISNSIVYRGIRFEDIRDEFLLKMNFNTRSKVFNQIDAFCDWFDKVRKETAYENWNVIVPSAGPIKEEVPVSEAEWRLGSYTLTKVNRSKKVLSMDYNRDIANIGVLLGPTDIYADITDENITDKYKLVAKKRVREQIRQEYNLDTVPQLIIYRINKDSKVTQSYVSDREPTREDLNFKKDAIGVYINIPSDQNHQPHAKALTVQIENVDENE